MATMTKYHMTDEGKLAPCSAHKRACKYAAAEHTFLSLEQQVFMRDVVGIIDPKTVINTEQRELQRAAATAATQGLVRDMYAAAPPEQIEAWALALFDVTEAEWAQVTGKPFSKSFYFHEFSQYNSPAGYTSDGYGDPPGYSAADDPYDDGYGRHNVYYGLRVDPDIDPAQVAETFYRPRNAVAKRVAIAYVRLTGLDQAHAYGVEAEHGYYGQEAHMTITPEAAARVRAFRDFFPAPNAH